VWVRGGRDRLVERMAGRDVEGRHARRESIRGRFSIAWASCSPRERPLVEGGSVARKPKGLFMFVFGAVQGERERTFASRGEPLRAVEDDH